MNTLGSSRDPRLGIRLASVLILVWSMNRAVAAVGGAPEGAATPEAPVKPSIDEVLRLIDVGPYHVPPLPLMTNQNYAKSSADVEPFGAIKPFKEHFLTQMEYTGPGRAIPEPEHVESVKIGFLGPIMPTVSVATGGKSHEEVLGIAMLRGCRLAIEHANVQGGYHRRKIPFELVVRNDNGLWGASGNEIVSMAYKDHVWAILGTIDGANTHIAIRVALKAELPMMTTGDLDPTYIETNIPWVFRNISDDRQQNYLLVDYLFRKLHCQRVAIIRSSNRYGRFGVREIRDGSRRLGRPVVIEMAYRVGEADFTMQLERIRETQPDALIHWGNAVEGARVLNQMRAMGLRQPFLTCDRCVSDEFVRLAGANADGVICTYPWNPTREDSKLEVFRKAFRERWGAEPDTYAAHAYDGMNMCIWAIQTAGLNRAKIRDVLAHRPDPFPGVTGDIPLSATLDDAGDVFLTRHENGQWKYYSREDWEIPRGRVVNTMRVEREQTSAP